MTLSLRTLFYDEMKIANFNVVGNPDKMFAGALEERVNTNLH